MNEVVQYRLVLWAFLFHNPSKCTKTNMCYKKEKKEFTITIIPCDDDNNKN